MQQIGFRAMGSDVGAMVAASSVGAAAAVEDLSAQFAVWEQALSRFDPTSELSRLNRAGGAPFAASETLWTVLDVALAAAATTGGLVTPTVLGALEAAGYDRSWELVVAAGGGGGPVISREPGATAVAASAATSWRAIERDPATRTLRLPPGLRLDLGGVAKGWAADRAVADLAAHGPALVDAGGDIAAGGASPDWVGWPIGVADPRRPAADLALLRLREGGVATSGQDYRRWRRDGGWQHHLIDPRTGRPAQTDVLSATVVGPSAAAAEAAAKAVLLLGVAAGLAWLEARPELAALVIDLDGRAWPSCRFEECLWR